MTGEYTLPRQNFPPSHFVGFSEILADGSNVLVPSLQKYPEGHVTTGKDVPGPGHMKPAGHISGNTAAQLGHTKPVGHAVQLPWAFNDWYVPGGHSYGVTHPVPGQKFPFGHCTASDIVGQKYPFGQPPFPCGCVDPAGHQYPA